MECLYHFYIDEDGSSAVEYGLLVALIAMVVLVAVNAMFNSLNSPFGKVNVPFTR